ncbi:AbrB/MazE/SpoVT family DNA-binding domain-containing protein [Candidatus Uhrbacteria bacterium]|nr:AbrB/MazE/SpoVT family DNA-binding domain-containing protein [Candidatus Uhrbacteria bacterium]
MATAHSVPARIATRVGPKHQVTIPKEVFSGLKLEVGDYLEFEFDGTAVRIAPKKLIAKEDAWFHSPEWQAKEQEADRAIQRCELSGPFKTASALLRHLKKGTRPKK